MAINKNWLREFAYAVKTCPKCKQRSFGLIFESEEMGGEVWECANSTCGYNPSCSGCRKGTC